jgi:hypothetical protein
MKKKKKSKGKESESRHGTVKKTGKSAARKSGKPAASRTRRSSSREYRGPIRSVVRDFAPRAPGRYRTFEDSGDLLTVTIESQPNEGMQMRFAGVPLTSNPQVFHLPRGEYLLEWSFTGPPKASYRIDVTGARDPTEPITDSIADDQNIAAGTYNVLV